MPSDDLFAERRRKVDELAARGIPSYGVDFAPSATTDEARRLLERVRGRASRRGRRRTRIARWSSVAGRIMQLRDLGGAAFAHVEDETGPHADVVPRRSSRRTRTRWSAMLDLGDIVGITGPLTRTRRGEPSVLVDTVTLLVKSLHCAAGEVPRPAGPGDEVPQALSRPAQQCLAAPPLRHADAADPRAASDAGSARLSRGRDADPAADSRRRPCAAVSHALERAAHRRLPAHRHRAAPQAFASSAGTRVSTRSVASFATRDCRRGTTRSSRCSRRTRRTRRTTTCASSPSR